MIFFAGGDDAGVGAAVAGGDGETLQLAGDDIGIGGRLQDAERDGFGEDDDEEGAAAVGDLRRRLHLLDDAEEVGRLDDDRGGQVVHLTLQVFEIDGAGLVDVAEFGDRHALVLRVGIEHFAILGMDAAGDEHAAFAGGADRHHGGFGHGGGAIVHGGVGHVHAGELADHGLEFEDGGEGALRDFGLVGRVGGEELAAGDDGIDQHGAVVVVDAGAEKRGIAVGGFGGAVAEVLHDLVLADPRGQFERPVEPDRFGQVLE